MIVVHDGEMWKAIGDVKSRAAGFDVYEFAGFRFQARTRRARDWALKFIYLEEQSRLADLDANPVAHPFALPSEIPNDSLAGPV